MRACERGRHGRRYRRANVRIWTAAIVAAAGACAAAAQPSTTTRGGAASSRPVWPDVALQRSCDEAMRRLHERTGRKLAGQVAAPFVVAGDLPIEGLNRIVRQTIEPAAAALWSKYFEKRPGKPITILLFAKDDSYRRWANELFGDKSPPHFGYYRHDARTMVMNIGTGTGTLVHEMVHALAEPDFRDMPDWFSEGLASLYEQCTLAGGDIRGLVNWRLPALQEAARAGRMRSLRSLMTSDDFHGEQEGLNYAQARYFCLYLQSLGRLEEFYRTFRRDREADPRGVRSVERVLEGRGVDEIDRAFRAWVVTLEAE